MSLLHAEPATLTLTLPPEVWMTSNRPVRSHAHRARMVREIHARTALAAGEAGLHRLDGPVHVMWSIRYPKGTGWLHGDAANAHPTAKAILDGLVLVGVLPGDGPRFVRYETFARGENLIYPRLHDVDLTLVQLGHDDAPATDLML
jgi:hypothetical protein